MVDTEQVERNLNLLQGKQLSERVMIACAHKLGRQQAHEILRLHANRPDFVQALEQDDRIASVMSRDELKQLLDPHTYTGLASEIVQTIVDKYGVKAVDASAPSSSSASALTYAQAGVDIEQGDSLVTRIKPFAASTARPGSDAALGGFGGLFDLAPLHYKDPVLVAGTDGVGTKLSIAAVAGRHDSIGIDLVAMSVNDLIVQGAEPLFFLDYFATSRLDVSQAASVIQGIADGCKRSGCALIGGETAELPGMYRPGDYDLAGFAVGVVERDRLLPRTADMREGDVLLGLASDGVHSNGYSLVRRIVTESGADYNAPPPFPSPHQRLCDELLTPTRLYVRPLLAVLRSFPLAASCPVLGLAHITGGGLTLNINRVLPSHLTAAIDGQTGWPMPPVFHWLRGGDGVRAGGRVEDAEMVRVFNCGVGMAIVVRAGQEAEVMQRLQDEGEKAFRIGTLRKRADGEEQVVVEQLHELFAPH